MKNQLGFTMPPSQYLFRELSGKEEEVVTVLDNRNLQGTDRSSDSGLIHPLNDVLIVCDHASNDLKSVKPQKHEELHMQSHDAYDPGAVELTIALSERLQCMSAYTNFTKLLVDPSQGIISQDLIPSLYKSSRENR